MMIRGFEGEMRPIGGVTTLRGTGLSAGITADGRGEGWQAMTMDDADPGDPVLSGDEVRNVTFGKGLYDASQVNDLLDRIAAELAAGRPAGPLIATATFQRRNPPDTPLPYTPHASVTASPSGYDAGAVDWFLEQLRRREDPAEAARMNADPWRDLPAEPYCIHREPADLAGRIA